MASDDKLKRTIKTENMEMRQSPPKAIVDCSPLQPAISKNKEGNFVYSLTRKYAFLLSLLPAHMILCISIGITNCFIPYFSTEDQVNGTTTYCATSRSRHHSL